MEALITLLKDASQIEVILQNILSYVIYIYPGLISIYWYNFLEAQGTKDTKALVIKGFSISYLYNILLGHFLEYRYYEIIYNIFLIAISLLGPWIFKQIKYSEPWEKVSKEYGIRACMVTVPFELLKNKNEKYTCLKVYLNDGVSAYIGYMYMYEYENDNEKFIILTGYKKYVYKDNKEELVINNDKKRTDQKVFIKYSDIKIIEKIAEDIAEEIYKK